MKSKLTYLMLITTLICFFMSCGKDEYINSVTRMPVYFTVDLNKDNNLQNLYQHKVYTKKDLIYDREQIESPGVIVINIGDVLENGMSYAAYDIRCPYEDKMNITLNISGIEAECSSCKAKYDLTFGNCTNGVTKKSLQTYCVSKDNSSTPKLKIRNCN